MEINVDSTLVGSVVRIKRENTDETFGTNMLAYNRVSGVVGAKLHKVDNYTEYEYEVGEAISLTAYLQKKGIGFEVVKDVFSQIISVLEKQGAYFLGERDLFLVPEYIFVGVEDERIKILYLDGYNKDVKEGLGKIAEEVISDMSHDDKDFMQFAYGLHSLVLEDGFTLNRLRNYISTDKIETKESGSKRNDNDKRSEKNKRSGNNKRSDKNKRSSYAGKNIEKNDKKNNKKNAKSVIINKVTGERDMVEVVRTFGLVILGVMVIVAGFRTGILRNPMTLELNKIKAVVYIVVVCAATYVALRLCVPNKNAKVRYYLCALDDNSKVEIDKVTVIVDEEGKVVDVADFDEKRIGARIVIEDMRPIITDNESDISTVVNDRELLPWERCVLGEGDVVEIGGRAFSIAVSGGKTGG